MTETFIGSDFLFYESGTRLYYVGRCSGDNESIGWHLPGKMGGLWIDTLRILSSIQVKEHDQVRMPERFQNHGLMKRLVFSFGTLSMMAHPFLPVFFLIGGSWGKDQKIWLTTDATPVWLEKSRWEATSAQWHRGKGSWKRRECEELGDGCSFFLDGEGVELLFRSGVWVLSPTRREWTIQISKDAPFSIPFHSAREEKQKYLQKYLPAKSDGIGYWAAHNALDLFMERDKGAGFAAGFPEFPWWFGIDSIYTCLGLIRTPMLPMVRRTIDNLLHYGNGFPVHEITAEGKVYSSARMNEVLALIWLLIQYTQHSGETFYVSSVEKLVHHVLRHCDQDGFPLGEGIIEVPTPKLPGYLDCASWWVAILKALNQSPTIISGLEATLGLSDFAQKVERNFLQRWKRTPSLFFDIKTGTRMDYLGHFIQVYPYELGIVDMRLGKESMGCMIEEGYFSPYGLVHSLPIHTFDAGDYGNCLKNEMTWTLPAILGLRAAKRYGMDILFQKLLTNLQAGLREGMVGAIPEILSQPCLPNNGCIVQAWNGYLLQDDLWNPQSL